MGLHYLLVTAVKRLLSTLLLLAFFGAGIAYAGGPESERGSLLTPGETTSDSN